MSRECQSFLADLGIAHRTSIAYQPEQNGMIERLNRTLAECAESMRYNAGLSEEFWSFAINAVHLINRRPHSALEGHKTPFKAWFGHAPHLDYLKVFGCVAYAHLPNQLHHKLDARSAKCIFVGYAMKQKGYQLWDPSRKRIITARYSDVRFDENQRWITKEDNPDRDFTYLVDDEPQRAEEIPNHQGAGHEQDNQVIVDQHGIEDNIEDHQAHSLDAANDHDSHFGEQDEIPESPEVLPPGSVRHRRPPGEWWLVNLSSTSTPLQLPLKACEIETPMTVKQATHTSNRFHDKWQAAINKEYDNLIQSGTWELCQLPQGRTCNRQEVGFQGQGEGRWYDRQVQSSSRG